MALIAVTLAQVALGAQVRGRRGRRARRGTPRAARWRTVGDYDRWHRDTAAVVLGGTVLLLLLVVTQTGIPRAVARAAYVTAGFVVPAGRHRPGDGRISA